MCQKTKVFWQEKRLPSPSSPWWAAQANRRNNNNKKTKQQTKQQNQQLTSTVEREGKHLCDANVLKNDTNCISTSVDAFHIVFCYVVLNCCDFIFSPLVRTNVRTVSTNDGFLSHHWFSAQGRNCPLYNKSSGISTIP